MEDDSSKRGVVIKGPWKGSKVEDKKLLNMVQLYLGRHITKVESYKLRSEISNENKDN